MSNSYLQLAEHILMARRQPMTAQMMLENAERYQLLPAHLSGSTMQKTLQARIAEDIFRYRTRSRFYRTGQGTYFLRALSGDTTLPGAVLSEHPTKPRKPQANHGKVLCLNYAGRLLKPGLHLLRNDNLDRSLLNHSSYQAPQAVPEYAYPVVTFCMVRSRLGILTFRIGRFSKFYASSNEPSIGLRRHIDEFDIDLLDNGDDGIYRCNVRILGRYIDLTALGLDDMNVRPYFFRHFSLIDNDRRRIGVICTFDFSSFSSDIQLLRRLGISQPRWTPLEYIGENYGDSWSNFALGRLNTRGKSISNDS